MFKSTSQNMQARARNNVVENTKNASVDVTAYEAANQRDRLVMQKRELEIKVRGLTDTIKHAQRNYNVTGNRMNSHSFGRWMKEKNEAIAALLDIERQLSSLRLKRRILAEDVDAEREKRFERMFMRMAKELLAHPVYERIIRATIHQVSEEETSDAADRQNA